MNLQPLFIFITFSGLRTMDWKAPYSVIIWSSIQLLQKAKLSRYKVPMTPARTCAADRKFFQTVDRSCNISIPHEISQLIQSQ